MDTEPHDIMQILKEFNQEYVLSFWNDLTDEEKNILANQVRSIDFAKMNMLYYMILFHMIEFRQFHTLIGLI